METLIFKDDTLVIDWIEAHYQHILDEMSFIDNNDSLKEKVRSIIQYGNFAEVIENMMERSETKGGEVYKIPSRFKAKRAVNYAKISAIQLWQFCTKDFVPIYTEVNALIYMVEYILVYSHKIRQSYSRKFDDRCHLFFPKNNARDELISQGTFDDYPAYFPKENKPKENKD